MTLAQLIEDIKKYEGFVDHVYADPGAGIKTIGYGFTAQKYINMKKMSKAQADKILRDEIVTLYEKVCVKLVRWGYLDINLNQICALVDFTYNCGMANLENLTRKGKRSLKEISKAILLYDHAGGKKLAGLTKRRKYEQDMFNGKEVKI